MRVHALCSTYLSGVQCASRVLLVGEDQQDGVLQLLLLQHRHQLLLRYAYEMYEVYDVCVGTIITVGV